MYKHIFIDNKIKTIKYTTIICYLVKKKKNKIK